MTVVGARVVSATDTTRTLSDSAYVRASAHGAGGGIDALFDRIAAGIRDTAHAAVHVAFDPARGYPTRITFDRRWFVSDDELHIDVREVEALP